MKVTTLAILFLLVMLASCGNRTKGPVIQKLLSPIGESEISDILNRQVFECAGIDGASCPEGIARLFIVNKKNRNDSYYCSGVMIDKNTLLTNYHCINSQETCDSTYLAVYNGHSYFQSKCLKVKKLITDHRDPDDPLKYLDIAIIKIKDDYYGGSFKLATKRALPEDQVTAWVIDHTGLNSSTQTNPYESRVTQFNCKVSAQKERKSLVLENCPIIIGNSGSPVVNSAGEIVALIWGGNALQMNSQWDLNLRRSSSEYFAASTDGIYFSPKLNK